MNRQYCKGIGIWIFVLFIAFLGGIPLIYGQGSLAKDPVPESKKDPLLIIPGIEEGSALKERKTNEPIGMASSNEIKPVPDLGKVEKHSGSVKALTAVSQPDRPVKPVPSSLNTDPPAPGSANSSDANSQKGTPDHSTSEVQSTNTRSPDPRLVPLSPVLPNPEPLSVRDEKEHRDHPRGEYPEKSASEIPDHPEHGPGATPSSEPVPQKAPVASEGTTVKVAPGVEGTTVKVNPGGGHPEKEIVVIQAPAMEKEKDQIKNKDIHKYLKTPRKVFEFIGDAAKQTDYIRGTNAFDFSDFPKMSDQEKKDCVYKLDFIISRITDLKTEEIPDLANENRYLFWPNIDYPPLELVKKGEIFQFGTKTINRLDDLYQQLKDKPPYEMQEGFLSFVPASWYVKHYGLSGLQWGGLLIFIILGYFIGLIAIRILYYITLISFRFLERSGISINYKVTFKMWQPLGWLFTYSIWYLGIVVIKAPPLIADIVGYPIRFLCILMCMLTAFRLVDFISEIIRDKARKNFSKIDEILVPIFSRSMKMLIIFVGVVMAIQMIGFSVIGIVSGMGIGGIAVALAAQNTIANFFGSITVLMDQPFAIGDWIVVNGTEGEVEAVGMRSTRVRTFYNSLVTIPNNLLTTAVIDNMGRRHFRRYKTYVKVEYGTTPEVLELFCEGIRQLILSYPNTRKDAFHVYVNEMGEFSIDILLVCFFLVPDQASENKARARLILDIMRLAEKLKVGFAFPSQTIYAKVEEDPGIAPKTVPPTVDEVRDYVEMLINQDKMKLMNEKK